MRVYTDTQLGLNGGEWRYDPFRRVQVWVPNSPVNPACAFDDPPPKQTNKAVVDNRIRRVSCPTCDGTKSVAAKTCDPCARTVRRNQPINHGTTSGYRTHLRRGVPLCDECREAHHIDGRQRRAAANQIKSKEAA